MKKFSILALVVILALSFAACGRKDDTANRNTTVPTTENSILPEMDPTMDTNIPDDNVNDNSTGNTDTTDTTNGNTTDRNNGTTDTTNGSTTDRNNGSTGTTDSEGTMK